MHIIDSKQSSDFFLKTLYADIESSSIEDKFIAVDTEFIRENLEKPLLCLIQIATANNTFIIDPLVVDVSFLNIVFNDEKLQKIFHSAKQDIEILSTLDITIQNLYDTQIYEMILENKERVSYKYIVEKYLGTKLAKSHTLSDWSKRPLSKKQLNYCVSDVTYLRQVYKKQYQELIRLNRINWLDDELKKICKKEDVTQNNNDDIHEKNLEIFNELIDWRNNKASEKNIDPELIVKRDFIKSVCTKGKDFILMIKHSRQKKNQELKEFLNFAEKKSDFVYVTKKDSSTNTTLLLLKILLETCAQEHCIAASVIATIEGLEKVLKGDENIKCFAGWRNEIFGNHLKKLLNGDLSISIKNYKIQIQ